MNTIAITEFATKDFGLATALLSDGIKYIRADREEDGRRLSFVFEAHEDIARIQVQRANGNHIVSSTHYEESQRKLKSIIHSV